MTATVSTEPNKNVKKISPPLHNWKQNVRGGKKLAIILTVLHMVAMPAVLLSTIISIYSHGGTDNYAGTATIAVLTTALAGFMGIFAAVDSFSCLHNKTVVDMKLSLPMTAAQRFVSNFLSGLFTYIVPFLTAQVFSLLLALYGRIFMEGRTFYHIRFDNVWVPYTCDVFTDCLPMLLKLIAGGLLAMLMLYTVTVLITTCCGSKFESIAYTILINVLIPATILCVTYSIFDGLYGFDPSLPAVKLIMYTSTAGGILAAVDWANGSTLIGYATNGSMHYGAWALVYLLIIAALFALAFFLYRKRRAEQVSKPFVFKLVYYITVTCGTFCLVSLLTDEIFPAIIITAVVYMIFEVVTNRGFKRFWLSIIKYVCTFIAAAVLIFVGQKTEGFGSVYRVPAAAAVTSAEIYYEGFYGDFLYIETNFYGNEAPIVIKDKENIKTIISAHKTAVLDYKERENKYGTDDVNFYLDSIHYKPLTIKYNLIGGGSLYRRYSGLCSEAEEILAALDVSEEYKTLVAETYRESILEVPVKYENIIESARRDNEEYRVKLVAYTRNRILPNDDFTKVSVSSLCERGFYEQLADAYCKDIMAINEENYFRSEFKNVWTLYTCSSDGDAYYSTNAPALTVPESFENTVALLEKFDFNLKRVETADEREILDYLTRAASSGSVTLFTGSEWSRMNDYGSSGVIHAQGQWVYGEGFESYVYDFDENVIELIRNAMPRNIVSENGYIISVYNFSGAIPEEMNGTAAAVTRTGRDEEAEKLYNEIANRVSTTDSRTRKAQIPRERNFL